MATKRQPAQKPAIPAQVMDTSTKLAALQRLLDQSKEIAVRDSDDPTFKTWKNTVERTLVRIYGDPSPEVDQFKHLRFFYSAMVMSLGSDYSHEHREAFERDFQILTASLRNYIEELQHFQPVAPSEHRDLPLIALPDSSERRMSRVFVSHASADLVVVEELVDLLETIGLSDKQIFCTSLPGYGIDLGKNFLEAIKQQLTDTDTLVLFLLSRQFYSSPISLCEMGATWVLAKEHIPILIPPLDFVDVEGVFPSTQGFKILEPLKLNLFKERIESAFGIDQPLSHSAWERKRDRALDRIRTHLATSLVDSQSTRE